MNLFSKKNKQNKEKLPNGFTPVPNDLIEALAEIPLISNYEYRVLLVIIRKTYGFNKNEDWISISQISKYTKISLSHVCRTVKKLMNKSMILRDGKLTSIQKDFKQWNVAQIENLPKKVTLPKQATTNLNIAQTGNLSTNEKLPKQAITQSEVAQTGNKVAQTGNQTLPKQANTKDIITKEIDIKERNTYSSSFEEFWELYPRQVEKKDAFKAFEKLMKDGVSLDDILLATKNYAEYLLTENTELKYIKHPTTFLNADRWQDWLDPEILKKRDKIPGAWFNLKEW